MVKCSKKFKLESGFKKIKSHFTFSGDQVNVLGIGARSNNKKMQTFQKLMNEMYDLNLQY